MLLYFGLLLAHDLQWGYASSPGTSFTNIIFPLTFNTCLFVNPIRMASRGEGGDAAVSSFTESTAIFDINRSYTYKDACYWFAVGK